MPHHRSMVKARGFPKATERSRPGVKARRHTVALRLRYAFSCKLQRSKYTEAEAESADCPWCHRQLNIRVVFTRNLIGIEVGTAAVVPNYESCEMAFQKRS